MVGCQMKEKQLQTSVITEYIFIWKEEKMIYFSYIQMLMRLNKMYSIYNNSLIAIITRKSRMVTNLIDRRQYATD